MSQFPTTLPEVDEVKITQVIDHLRLLTLGKGADFIIPADIQANLDPLASWYPDDATTQLLLDDIWRKVKDMHTTTGQAVTWIAVQQSLIEDLHHQRDALLVDVESYEAEERSDVYSALESVLMEIGCDEEEIEIFAQVFYGGSLDETAKHLIRELVSHVYAVEMEEFEHVN